LPVNLTTHLCVVSRLGMRGAVTPFPMLLHGVELKLSTGITSRLPRVHVAFLGKCKKMSIQRHEMNHGNFHPPFRLKSVQKVVTNSSPAFLLYFLHIRSDSMDPQTSTIINSCLIKMFVWII
jgi:hypothetical protein